MGIFSSTVMGKYNLALQHVKQADFPRFDFLRPGEVQRTCLLPLAWALSFPDTWKHKTTIRRDLKGVKPPYIILANHNSFYDFKVLTRAIFPRKGSYVVALDGFIGREGIMRLAGCIGKRKFTNDLQLIRQVKHYLEKDQIFVLYPEARYSICGVDTTLPGSLGKFIKLMKVPVVTLLSHGHHVDKPMWHASEHGLPTESDLKLMLSADEVMALSSDEIQAMCLRELAFDDWQWLRDKDYRLVAKDRAEGLHNVLYRCRACGTDGSMTTSGTTLSCQDCGSSWHMDEQGTLHRDEESIYPPQWYLEQKEMVRQEIASGNYHLDCEVLVDSLPNSKGFVPMGKGRLVHDYDGLHLYGEHAGEAFEVHKSVPSLYSIHVELDYLDKKLNCIDISTADDTYFVYPTDTRNAAVKIAFAVECLFEAL